MGSMRERTCTVPTAAAVQSINTSIEYKEGYVHGNSGVNVVNVSLDTTVI
jgi:hypothetical protein